jgi:hypothetical protein
MSQSGESVTVRTAWFIVSRAFDSSSGAHKIWKFQSGSRKMKRKTLVATLAITLGGCGHMSGPANQSVSINTFAGYDQVVQGAVCELHNDAGKWTLTSPGTVQVTKSSKALKVSCQKEGHEQGLVEATARPGGPQDQNAKYAMFIPVVGFEMSAIDYRSGIVFNYPAEVPVYMGQSVLVQIPAKPFVQDAQAK